MSPATPPPASAAPGTSATEGKTPAFDDRQVRTLPDSFEIVDVVSIHAKTLLMILAYTAARAGDVAKLRTMDYLTDGRSWSSHLGEEGGKLHRVQARQDLQVQVEVYLRAAGLEGRPDKTPREQVRYLPGRSDARTTDPDNRAEKEVTGTSSGESRSEQAGSAHGKGRQPGMSGSSVAAPQSPPGAVPFS